MSQSDFVKKYKELIRVMAFEILELVASCVMLSVWNNFKFILLLVNILGNYLGNCAGAELF